MNPHRAEAGSQIQSSRGSGWHTAKPQVRNVTGPIPFAQSPFTTRQQHMFLLGSLDVGTGRGTVRGRCAREKIRGTATFDRIAVLAEAE